MRLSALHVGELVAELERLLLGWRILAVEPLPPRDLLLVLVPGEEVAPAAEHVRRLRISADPEAARVHLELGRVQRHEGPADPFFARVRECLSGTRVREIAQLEGDRVVRLSSTADGTAGPALVAELTGRHANLVLLGPDGVIERSLVRPASGTPASARLAPGQPYRLPGGGRPGRDAGPPLAEAFPAATTSSPLAERAPLSARVQAALGGVSQARARAAERADLVRRLERRLHRARDRIRGLQESARSCADAERLRRDGELLLAHMGEIARGSAEAVLPDDYQPDSPERRISIDPGLSPRRNAEKLFARARKLARTEKRLPQELALAEAQAAELEALLERAGDPAVEPGALLAEALASGLLAPPQGTRARARPAPRRAYLSFAGSRGSEIRVGRTADENDRLTFRESRGNDLWLHTADSPGSHVVLRLEKGAEPRPEEVLDAAHLAVHFSPLRGASRADVHVARCKEVHKPRRAAPGLVTLSGGKVLRVRIEPARLERLLATRGRARAASQVEDPGQDPGEDPEEAS